MEASGTGNMKLSLNGALTIGTLDGANIEIRDAVGEENIFIFGMTAEEVVARRRARATRLRTSWLPNPELKRAIERIDSGYFTPDNIFGCQGVADRLLGDGEHFLVLADFAAYAAAQDASTRCIADQEEWTRKAVHQLH